MISISIRIKSKVFTIVYRALHNLDLNLTLTSLSSSPPGDVLCLNCLLSVPLPPNPLQLLACLEADTCCSLCLDCHLVSFNPPLPSFYMREYSYFLLILQLSASHYLLQSPPQITLSKGGPTMLFCITTPCFLQSTSQNLQFQ